MTALPRIIAITGATGNQGGSVARHLLNYPEKYRVRAVTRNLRSKAAQDLAEMGAELIQADLTKQETLPAVVKGCWGVFGVTNFYDSEIKNDPGSEEAQGKNLVRCAADAGVECFIWSSLPSSAIISNGRLVSRIYEGKFHVDDFIKEIGLPASILYTGNFYENMVLRNHITYNSRTDTIEFTHTIIRRDTKLAMLYVEKDLAAITMAIFDTWDKNKDQLNHKILYCADARVSPDDIISVIEKASGRKTIFKCLPTTDVPDRDIMYTLYNEMGMYQGKQLPDETIINTLGVKMTGVEEFVRERLLPHLGLPVVG